jgi:hypothetical protein
MPKTEFQQEQEWVLKSKPYLRFRPGDVVYLKSDFAKKNPMVVTSLLDIAFEEDYSLQWFDDKNCMQGNIFFDYSLFKAE